MARDSSRAPAFVTRARGCDVRCDPGGSLSVDAEDVAPPFDRPRVEALHEDGVEAAGRLAADHREVAVCGGDEAPALGGGDAGDGAAETPRTAHPDLDEDQHVAIAGDQVDFPE